MKKKIALITGGFSGESVISYKTARTIDAHLDKGRYEVYLIDIRAEGWLYQLPDGRRLEVDKNDFSLNIDGRRVKFDGVFIALHGTPGEDGKLQGYFDMLGIPYTSCDAATSAITFNKRYTVAIAAMAGIPVAPSVHLFRGSDYPLGEIRNTLAFPVFVKPNNGGSSIGMSKVADFNQLGAAIDKAFKEDDQVLVEQMIQGREFTVGVFKADNHITVLPFTEIRCEKEFFDFDAKYDGSTLEITPAEADEETRRIVSQTAEKIYRIFNCRGVVRIDFIYQEQEKKAYMLEVNTIPGQSETSIIPQQVSVLGWDLKDFYSKLVEACLA